MVQLLVFLCTEKKNQSPHLIKRKEILKENAVGWHNKVTLVVISFIALHVIIAFFIIRSIDHTHKAVGQLTLTQLRNFHLPCNFRVFRSAYLGFMSLYHLRTSESVVLPEQKLCINLLREVHSCKSYRYFAHHIFSGCFTQGALQHMACNTKIRLWIC